jgi:hypothetical protein
VRETPFDIFGVGVLKVLLVITPVPGVVLPAVEGVTRPLRKEAEGVLGIENDGVVLPLNAGVVLPPRDDATDDGRTAPGPTVGGESFVVATKTPHFSGHEKYCLLENNINIMDLGLEEQTYPATEPSFFPFPEKPPLNSTPAQRPGLPSISPMYLRAPSKPRDSILTFSPTSKVLESLLEASDCLLGGRLAGRVNAGVFARSGTLADDVEAAEEGRPATERLPEDRECEIVWGESEDVEEVADKGIGRW